MSPSTTKPEGDVLPMEATLSISNVPGAFPKELPEAAAAVAAAAASRMRFDLNPFWDFHQEIPPGPNRLKVMVLLAKASLLQFQGQVERLKLYARLSAAVEDLFEKIPAKEKETIFRLVRETHGVWDDTNRDIVDQLDAEAVDGITAEDKTLREAEALLKARDAIVHLMERYKQITQAHAGLSPANQQKLERCIDDFEESFRSSFDKNCEGIRQLKAMVADADNVSVLGFLTDWIKVAVDTNDGPLEMLLSAF